MSMAYLKDVIKTVAPTIATMLGGPAAGGAIAILADTLLGGTTGSRAGDVAAIQQRLAAGLSPEDRLKLIEAENALKVEMIKAGIREKEIALEAEKAHIGDTAHARESHKGNDGILILGYVITVLSYLLVGLVMVGAYYLATGGMRSDIDPSFAMVLGSVVGAALQFVFMNAASASGFFFGSSPGSRQMAVDLSKSVGEAVAASGKRR